MQTQEVTESNYLSTEQLYRAHRPFVARFLTRLGVRPEQLDDAVQEVFVTVHRRGGYVLGPAKPTTYLATIAMHTAAAQRRSSRKLAARHCEQEPEDLAARGCDPGEVFEARQELSRLDRALSRLEPTLRDTLLAADGEGETCVAIADATSVPLGTVYWRLDRARKKFREAMRTVDGPQRRRVGMFLACLSGNKKWWKVGKKSATAKLTTGMSALAVGMALFAMHEVSAAPQPLQHLDVAELAVRSVEPPVTLLARAEQEPALEVDEPVAPRRARRVARVASLDTNFVQASSIETPSIATVAVKTTKPAPARTEPARAEPPREVSETMQLARAESLLARQPREALTLVRALDSRESANYLREERDYIELRALLGMGERAEGRERAAAFLRAYPDSAFARIVRSSVK